MEGKAQARAGRGSGRGGAGGEDGEMSAQDEVDALRETLVEERECSAELARAVLGWWEVNRLELDDPPMVTLASELERRLNGDGG